MNVDLEWYRVFYWTAKLGGFTHAAKKLNITQPAVSHTLKQLEDALGVQLFFRGAKGAALTAEGELLYSFAAQAIQLIELGEKKIAEMQNLLAGEIVIGASDTLCKHYLLPYMERFHRQYPEIRIRVVNRTTPETIALLKAGDIDFGIVHLPAEDARVHFRKCAALTECLVGAPKYAHLAAEPLPLSELRRWPLLLLEKDAGTRLFLDDYARSCGVLLQPEFELGSVDLLVEFSRRGFGLTIIAREYIREELRAGELIEIPLAPPVPERHIGIATLKEVPLSAAARRFLDFVLEDAGADAK